MCSYFRVEGEIVKTKLRGTKQVPSGKGHGTTSLFKIIVNNGTGNRVRVLFWGQKATEFSTILRIRNVITITRAKASAVNVKFNNPADNVGLIELSVTNSSTIQVARNLFQDDVDNSPPRVVKLEDAPNERGRLAVSGWLKLPFGPVVSFGSTIGSGVIIDGKFKLRVHVHDYRLPITFPQGAHIKVICESGLDRNEVSTILTVRSSADVSLDASKPPLTESEMRRLGMITPSKRKAVDDSNVATKKPTVG
ncbi:uncharacterized protein LOC123270111 [Cotesia glomerata]|uniref:uncharacterized protein LOC123270111 n=1 Tax=Cotesia glomerata TaxID=32391 RepID=UPI001D00F4A0|nr:uncharacterized protein LOC123270111 [Cotesia glomerata]